MLKFVFRDKEDSVTGFGGLPFEEEERVMLESGAGRGKEDDRFGLGLDEPWVNPQEEVLESGVLRAEGREGREGGEDPDSRPTVSRWRGLKVEPDLEFDSDERGDERGDVKTTPLA